MNRHYLALQSLECTDLALLGENLAMAAKEAKAERRHPNLDAACMLLAFQISFVGNSESVQRRFYRDLIDHCHANSNEQMSLPFNPT